MVLGDLDNYMQKLKLDHQIIPHTRITSRWIKDLNISCDTIKVLEENIDRKISDIPCSNIFIYTSPRARDIKERINKWDLIKLKSFCTAKENSIKMKKEHMFFSTHKKTCIFSPNISEKIFGSDTLDKNLIFKIYNKLTKVHSRKTNNPIKKMDKRPEQTLLQGGHTEGPDTYEKMLSITSYYRHAN